MHDVLATPIEFLKGVGPQRGELLRKELGIATFGDLLGHFPFRYVDRTQFHRLADVHAESGPVQVRGVLGPMRTVGAPRANRLVATFSDGTRTVDLVWFKGVRWLQGSLKPGQQYVLYGRPSVFQQRVNFAHPELELVPAAGEDPGPALQPVYHSTEKLAAKGLSSKAIAKLMRTMLPLVLEHLPENLPSTLVIMLGGMTRSDAIGHVHAPTDARSLEVARRRLKFEELFYVQLHLLQQKKMLQQGQHGRVFEQAGALIERFYKDHLPFEPTGAQKRVVKEIRRDMGSGRQMNRLVQGDVGSGKTLVALLAMLIALGNGFQCALMAPTEILAQQHFHTLSAMLRDMPVVIRLLTGSTRAAERKSLLTALRHGEIHIIVGTHALLEDRVVFQQLGLVVIDEQHRFGVAQRARLWAKAEVPPHVLVMTATPIPRTLAMTLYGDLDTSVIDEMPPGRKAVRTEHRDDTARNAVFSFLEREIHKGRQIYVVYPLVEESEKSDLKDVMDGFESLSRRFPLPRYAVGIVHGRMDQATKDYEMERFKKGETDVLVATTVIEVGVDVPNASVMVIENAERFGLSQLHQLRGRVGRGADQSYCILMTGDKLGQEARERIATMVRTNDGFEIAETDLRLRGPGDLTGTKQSGLPDLRIADLVEDAELMGTARSAAMRLLDADPELEQPAHAMVLRSLRAGGYEAPVWGRIS